MLYLVSTPIGNLSDITLRALEVLKSCDYILCEDTRHSLILLRHYEIEKPLKSFHKFNEKEKEASIIQDLEAGMTIGLISDAGTPGIADPGMQLVQKCVASGLQVQSVPGACSAITALSCSGLNTENFQFIGFLPKRSEDLKKTLKEILSYKGTTICFDSPQRILKTLKMLSQLDKKRKLAITRELTKRHEEILRGNVEELLESWGDKNPKGEIVLLISGKEKEELNWDHLTHLEHVQKVEEDYGVSRKEAIKIVAELRHESKRNIYKKVIKK